MRTLWVLSLAQEKVPRPPVREPAICRACRHPRHKERAFGSFWPVPKGTRPGGENPKPKEVAGTLRRKVLVLRRNLVVAKSALLRFRPRAAKTALRFLAPPLPTEPASLGFGGGPERGPAGIRRQKKAVSGLRPGAFEASAPKRARQNKKPSVHILGRKAHLPRYHPHSRLARTQSPDNGGHAVPLSGAAPGRTKGRHTRRLSAGDRLSLGVDALPIFPFLAFHTPSFIPQSRGKCKGFGGEKRLKWAVETAIIN